MAASILGRRLKEARQRTTLSQERLGIEAGLDPMSASVRVHRYEAGTRVPHPDLVEQLAAVLGEPVPYFYAEDDGLAKLISIYGGLSKKDRVALLHHAEAVADSG